MPHYKIIFTLFFFIQLYAKAQIENDFNVITKHIIEIKNSRELSVKKERKIQKSVNPIKAISFTFLLGYQKLLSEQFYASCEFDRSCSAFAINCFKEFGVFKALFLTADRLTRCNGVAQLETQNYLFNHLSGKIIDEPEMYRFND